MCCVFKDDNQLPVLLQDNKSEDALVVADFCNNALLGLSSLEVV